MQQADTDALNLCRAEDEVLKQRSKTALCFTYSMEVGFWDLFHLPLNRRLMQPDGNRISQSREGNLGT
ncbi:hypothetical protein MPTK2_8g18880 [Marchantia polymorpha subsp. ruderalis]